ncbi:hypothetical protein JST99_01475 [Candidatus Dependentiae bacterium]|nr:hypothetical protein [Candidatus Dependentiae bacterium]
MSASKKPQLFVSIPFQLVLIALSITILSGIYLHKLRNFDPVDPIEILNDYNPISLARFGDFYTKILTGLAIEQYETFDVINNNFVIVGTLWFLADPSIINLERLNKFSFQRGTLLSVSEPIISLEKKKLLVQYRIRLQFSTPLSYTYFPLDEHRVTLRLTNIFLDPEEIIFVSEHRYFNITANAQPFGWTMLDRYVRYGYRKISFDSVEHTDHERSNYDPCIDFFIDFTRTSYRYIISIIFPMLTFFYLSLFGFSTSSSSQFYLPTVGLTALISFRFIIDRLSPAVGYFMLSDYLFFIFLAAIFIAFVFLLLDEFSQGIGLLYRKTFIVVLHLLIIMLNIYFVI